MLLATMMLRCSQSSPGMIATLGGSSSVRYQKLSHRIDNNISSVANAELTSAAHTITHTTFFTQTCFLLGVRHLDDPAFGHSCYCGSFHILVRQIFFIFFFMFNNTDQVVLLKVTGRCA